MNEAILLMGGNKSNTLDLFKKAKGILEKETNEIILQSSIYKTAAWGNTNQNDFYNQAFVLLTKLTAQDLLEFILNIEKKLGRVRQQKWEARSIDIDIIFFNNEIINSDNLQVPHPLMHERKFVLIPLNEILPKYIHPVLHKSIAQLLKKCEDKLDVEMI